MAETKFEIVLNKLKQPSTIKGLLGIASIVALRFGVTLDLTVEDLQTIVESAAALYFSIAILWQKS